MHGIIFEILQYKFYKKKKGKQSWQQKKGRRKKSDSIYGQYTNVCQLGANWDH